MKQSVLHIITRFIKGGADAETLLTCAGLARRGYEVALAFGTEADPAMIRRAHQAGIRTIRLPLRHYRALSAIRAFLRILCLLRHERFAIVHTHSTEAGIIGRAAAWIARVPVIIHTNHGVSFSEAFPLHIRTIVLWLERFLAPKTTTIISNADTLTELYLGRGIGRKAQYSTICSGIPLGSFRVASTARLSHARGVPVLCCISRLTKDKGLEDLLAALQHVPRAHLVLAGDGPLRRALAVRARSLGVAGRTHFLGQRDDVPSVLAAADVFVLPSYREGTPRAITEAMASGLPIVTTQVGGIPDQVVNGFNGYLVPPGNPRLLAGRINELLDKPGLRRRMGSRSRHLARKWSAEYMVHGIVALYRRLLQAAC